MAFYILSSNRGLLQLLADTIDHGEGYPKPGGRTLHHALVETRHDGGEYALLADDVAAKYLGDLVTAVVPDADVDTVAADWQALQAGTVTEVVYVLDRGPFAGESARIGTKGPEWEPPETEM